MNTESLRLNKAIARAGLVSRRAAEKLVLAGEVRLNGEVVRDLAVSVHPGEDVLEVQGKRLVLKEKNKAEVWALYKPKRYVSTMHDPQGRPSLQDLLPPTQSRLFPVGRLDYDAEGLILLTNDGDFAQQVAHPSHSVEKVYLVKVKGLVPPQALKRLAEGPVLDGRKKRGVRARVLHNLEDKTWLEVTLREGVQHHIKKMFLWVGHRVIKIKRYQIGPVTLGEMEPGGVRKLGKGDIEALLRSAGAQSGEKKDAKAPKG